jgi:hypothetical protein
LAKDDLEHSRTSLGNADGFLLYSYFVYEEFIRGIAKQAVSMEGEPLKGKHRTFSRNLIFLIDAVHQLSTVSALQTFVSLLSGVTDDLMAVKYFFPHLGFYDRSKSRQLLYV